MDVARNWKPWAGVTAASAAALSAAWLWWVPAQIADVAHARASRLGLRAEFGDVSLGLGSVRFHESELLTVGPGLKASLRSVEASFSSFDAVLAGSPDRFVVEGGQIDLDVEGSGLRETLDRLAEGGGQGPGGKRRRDITLKSLNISAVASGTKIEARDVSVSRALDGWDLRAAVTSIEASGRRVVLHGPAATIGREEGMMRARHFSVKGGGFEAQLPRAVDLASDIVEIDEEQARFDEAEAADSDAGSPRRSPEPVPEKGASDGTPRHGGLAATIERLRSLAAERLSPSFRAELNGLSIRRVGEQRPAMTNLSLDLERLGPEGVRVRGKGDARRGGALSFDFRIALEGLRATGRLQARELPLTVLTPLLPSIPWFEPEQGSVEMDLELETDAEASVHFDGRFAVRNAGFDSPRISPEPVGAVNITVEGRGRIHPVAKRIELLDSEVSLNRARIALSGEASWSDENWSANASATLPPTACGDALAGIPIDLLGETAAFALDGQLGGRLDVRIDTTRLDEAKLRIRIADGCRFLMVPAAADVTRFAHPFVHSVLEPNGTRYEMLTGPGTDNWVPVEDMSPFLVHAVLTHEDGGFFGHSGFSKSSIQDSLVRNLREGRYAVGASTITMQLAKNLFLHREKTLARKVQEVILTWWLERAFTKKQILELYLNVIEYGPAVYGARHAADHYFGKAPHELSAAEAAFLACILPAPKRYHIHYERGSLSGKMTHRVRRFLGQMHARRRIDAAAYEQAIEDLGTMRFGDRRSFTVPVGRAAPLPFGSRIEISDVPEDAASIL